MLAVSVVIPAYMEGDGITPVLERVLEAVKTQVEVLVVVDFEEDSTVQVVRAQAEVDPRVRLLVSNYGRGPANAIRFGVDHATCVCVTSPLPPWR